MADKLIEDGFQGDGPMAGINVTSLVDVMFCLLIMFMVSTPLMAPQGEVKVTLPKARGMDIPEDDFMLAMITVDAKGNVYMGATPLSSDPARLAQEIANNPKLKEDGRAFLQGDENVPFERIVDVMVALQQAKVAKVGFVTDANVKRKK
ncbi:MAG: biopolymer transporter ExbD [Nannocystaceae bacterium]